MEGGTIPLRKPARLGRLIISHQGDGPCPRGSASLANRPAFETEKKPESVVASLLSFLRIDGRVVRAR